MVQQNFIAFGRTPGKCMFVHRDNVHLLKEYGYPSKVKCIRIDFQTGEFLDPVIVDVLLKFVPHEIISSEGEREVISDLVRETLSEEQIVKLNQQFDEIKYQE